MNKLATLIIEMLKLSLGLTAVISNNTEYTYEYILNASKNLAAQLNETYARRTKIALIADNSVEWIIVFLAIIFSKHQLVLFSSRLSKKKIYNILIYSRTSVVITDLDLDRDKTPTIFDVIIISDLIMPGEDEFHWLLEQDEQDTGIIVFTPRKMSQVYIAYDEITNLMGVLETKNIYRTLQENYVNYQDFTYNYVLCLLLPLLSGLTIVLPSDYSTAYSLKHTLKSQINETVILTGYQFELLWREYVENKTDMFTEFLYDFRLKRLRRWRIKRHLKQLFPNIQQLIILNSEVSLETEEILKKIKFPYTITYGTVETCGIATYSKPKDFLIESTGEPLSTDLKRTSENNLVYLKPDDSNIPIDGQYRMYQLDDKGEFRDNQLFFECRKSEVLETSYGFIVSRKAEKILKSLNLVTDCILVVYEEELVMIANINKDYCDYKNYTHATIMKMIQEQIHQINAGLETFSKIDKVRYELIDFSRDTYGRILRDTPFI